MSVTGTRRSNRFIERIAVPKSYDVLADKLRETILSGDFADGTFLPTERELMEQTGLSRGSVREALRKLEAEGLVRPQPGRTGGNLARLPTNEVMAKLITQFVRGRRISNEVLQLTRELVEPSLAQWAALNRSEEDLALLQTLYLELENSVENLSAFTVAYIDFHNTIARASKNDLLCALKYAISKVIVAATVQGDFDDAPLRRAGVRAHRRILDAIETKDGEAAHRRVLRHLREVSHRTPHGADLDLPGETR